MNKTTLIVTTVAVVAAAGGGYWLARGKTGPTSASTPASATETRTDARKPLYWYDPMRPEAHFDAPGPSPFMDMALVPKYADAAVGDEAGVVRIDPRMAQNLGVRTVRVKAASGAGTLEAVGSVAVDENRVAVVEARSAGWIERLDVKAVGDAVRAGQVVAALYSPDVLAAQEELALARKLGDATLIDAAQARLRLLDVKSGATPQRQSAITAPQSGIVTELMVRQGAQVSPGMPILKLADLSKVWIQVEVPEARATGLAPGQRVEAELKSAPGEVFHGTVDYVYPLLDAATRTVRARLSFENPDGRLKPGMFAAVRVSSAAGPAALAVPAEAVIRTGRRTVVIVAEAEGRFQPIDVRIGEERGDEIVVLEGLAEGQSVVVSGQFLIDSEASLTGTTRRMDAEDAP